MSTMTMSKKVVFFGNERLVSGLPSTNLPILHALIDNGYEILAIVANHNNGISRKNRELEVASFAKDNNIPLLLPNKPADIEQELREMNADCAVLAAYGRIIPQRIIDVFSPVGIINIHPSLLPRHRGPTPIETTILMGDKNAGVSIMQLTAGMDEGPVYDQVEVILNGTETKFDLHDTLSTLGANMLIDLLPKILSGELRPKPQQTNDVSYTSLINKNDGIIDPLTETASEIERKVRAHLGFPKSRLTYKDTDVIITSAKVTDAFSKNDLVIECKQNSTLLVESLVSANGKSMSGEAYLRGLH